VNRRSTPAAVRHLVERTAAAIDATVVALDEQGEVLAETGAPCRDARSEAMTVPFEIAGLRGHLRVDTPPPSLPAGLVQDFVSLLSSQLARAEAPQPANEVKNQFIHHLLSGTTASDEEVLREGQILGMDLSRPRAVILIDASAYVGRGGAESHNTETDLQVQSIIRQVVRFFSLPNDAICGYIGQGQIAVLKASTSRDLDRWVPQADAIGDESTASWSNLSALKRAAAELISLLEHETQSRILIGIGRYHPGIRGISRSYTDARAALEIGFRIPGATRLFCLDQLGLAALIRAADERTRLELATHLLGPLDAEEELRETLTAFFEEDCSIVATSARLFIHRNTLNYRLDKITALTGLDPKRFDDAMLLRFAFLLCQLASGDSYREGPPGEPKAIVHTQVVSN